MKKNKLYNIYKNINIKTLLKSAFLVAIFGLSLVAIAGWTPPTKAPTDGNVPPPVNVGTVGQYKQGVLGANGITTYGFQLGDSTTAGHVLTADKDGIGSWRAPTVGAGGGVTSVTASGIAPISASSSGGNTPNISVSISQAGNATNGYLSSAHWNTFNNKENTLTFNSPLVRSGNTITCPTCGAGGSGVSSVGLAMPTQFTVSNSPVTGSGTLTAVWNSQSQKTFLAAPNTANGVPTFRTILATDIPTLNQNTTGTAGSLSANGANCALGEYPRGIDASGNVEFCTAVPTGGGGSSQWDGPNNSTSPIFRKGIVVLGGTLSPSKLSVEGNVTIGYYGQYAPVNGLAVAGNVGIGRLDPTTKLDVVGDIRFSGYLLPNGSAGTSGQVLTSNGPLSTPTWKTPTGGAALPSGTTNQTLRYNGTNWVATSRLSFNDYGLLIVDTQSADQSTSLQLRGGGTMKWDIMTYPSLGDNNRFSIRSTNPATERLTILQNGNVGIGINNPSARFEVKATGIGYIAKFSNDQNNSCFFDTLGNLGCNSDIKLKKNIENINYGLNTVMSLRPILYNWKYETDNTEKNLGFIAQEVENIIPKLVTTDTDGLKSLNTIGIIPVLTKSIQELKTENDTLKARIEILEGKLK